MKKVITAIAATLIATSAIAAPVGGSYQADGGWTGHVATDHVTKTNLAACFGSDDEAQAVVSGRDALTDHSASAAPLCNTELNSSDVLGQ